MIRYFNNLPIWQRLTVLCVVPSIFLLIVGGNKLATVYQSYSDASSITQTISLAPRISDLVHELQKERGTSAGYIGSRGKRFADTIGQQRADTDRKLKVYTSILPQLKHLTKIEDFARPFEKATGALKELTAKRNAVDGFEITVPQMASYYTPLISNLLDMVESVSKFSSNGAVTRKLIAYGALLQGKERAGIERAMGAAGFGSGTFKPHIHKNFVRLGAMQDSYFDEYKHYASKRNIALLKQVFASDEERAVAKLRRAAEQAPFGGDISGISGPQWFATSTKRIDLLKGVEDKVAADIVARSKVIRDNQWAGFVGLSAALLVLLGVMVALSTVIAQSIARPINSLSKTMLRIADNDTSMTVKNVDRQDEIGKMARTVEVFRKNAIERNEMQEQIEQNMRDTEEANDKLMTLARNFLVKADELKEILQRQTHIVQYCAKDIEDAVTATEVESQEGLAASNDAAGNVQIVAAATEQLSSSTRQIAEQAQNALAITATTSAASEQATKDVSNLSNVARKIEDILQVITGIASQTNLLALNATIESARAGEAGKGFAVVANEVKALAEQTTKATDEVASLVTEISSSTSTAVHSIEQIATEIEKVANLNSEMSQAVNEQAAATAEISESAGRASRSTDAASGTSQKVSAVITESREKVREVKTSVQSLFQGLEKFKAGVDEFLGEIDGDLKDRRKGVRHRVNHPVKVEINGIAYPTTLFDINTEGVKLGKLPNVKPGSVVKIQFEESLETAEVVRQDDESVGAVFKPSLQELPIRLSPTQDAA